MQKLNKYIAICLLSFICLFLTACGDKSSKIDTSDSAKESKSTTSGDQSNPADEQDTTSGDQSNPADEQDTTSSDQSNQSDEQKDTTSDDLSDDTNDNSSLAADDSSNKNKLEEEVALFNKSDDSNLFFVFDARKIKSSNQEHYKNYLNKVVQFINQHKSVINNIVVMGYADPVGSEGYNMQLSKDRADGIVEYIKSKTDLEDTQITILSKYYGEHYEGKAVYGYEDHRRVHIELQ